MSRELYQTCILPVPVCVVEIVTGDQYARAHGTEVEVRLADMSATLRLNIY